MARPTLTVGCTISGDASVPDEWVVVLTETLGHSLDRYLQGTASEIYLSPLFLKFTLYSDLMSGQQKKYMNSEKGEESHHKERAMAQHLIQLTESESKKFWFLCPAQNE